MAAAPEYTDLTSTISKSLPDLGALAKIPVTDVDLQGYTQMRAGVADNSTAAEDDNQYDELILVDKSADMPAGVEGQEDTGPHERIRPALPLRAPPRGNNGTDGPELPLYANQTGANHAKPPPPPPVKPPPPVPAYQNGAVEPEITTMHVHPQENGHLDKGGAEKIVSIYDSVSARPQPSKCNTCALPVFATIAFLALVLSLLASSGVVYVYKLYNMHSVNHAPFTEGEWSRVEQIIAREVNKQLTVGLSPLETYNHTLEALNANMTDLRGVQESQDGQIVDLQEQLGNVHNDSTKFQNETTANLVQQQAELNESKLRIEALEQEMALARDSISELSSQQNETQYELDQLAGEYNESKQQIANLQEELRLTRAVQSEILGRQNQTSEEIEMLTRELYQLAERNNQTHTELNETVQLLREQAERETGQLRNELYEVQSNLTDQLQGFKSAFELQLEQEVGQLEVSINASEASLRADIDTLSNETKDDIAMVTTSIETTRELFANETESIQSEFTEKVDGIAMELNATEEQLSAYISAVNQTLQQVELTFEQITNNLTQVVHAHHAENNEDLLSVHQNLSTRIQTNKNDIAQLANNQNITGAVLSSAVDKLAMDTSSNFTRVEEAMSQASNASSRSLQDTRTELLEKITATNESLNSYKDNVSMAIMGVGITLDKINGTLSRQISENGEMITSVADEARRNHTQLQSVVDAKDRAQTTRLETVQSDLSQRLEGVSGRVDDLEEFERRVNPKISTLQTDLDGVEDEIEPLQEEKRRLSGELRSLGTKVDRYHSDGGKATGSKNIVTLFAAFAITLLPFLF